MRTLYLFNPDNDLALANGDENYVPSAQALRMGADLAFLPAWYAREAAVVLSPEPGTDQRSEKWYERLLADVRCLDKYPENFGELAGVTPWGWNAMLAKKLRLSGVPQNLIPSAAQIDRIRHFSNRSFSATILKRLQGPEWLCGSTVFLESVRDVNSFVRSVPDGLLKAPWSGSGKGIFWYEDGAYTPRLGSWAGKIIAKQGGLVAEPRYCKEKDFAMEFHSDGKGTVAFAGYSLFRTDCRGAYQGNLLASDEMIVNRLSRFTGREWLTELRSELERLLSAAIGGWYTGYLGVDMMVCRFEEKPYFRIHPCVEINLRMNMGVVPRLFFDRFVTPGSQGCFTVGYFKSAAALQENHREFADKHPLVVKNGKIRSGYLSLTPVGESTRYRASIRIV